MLLKTLLFTKKNAKPLALPTRPCALRVLGNLWLYLIPRSPLLWPLQLSLFVL